MTNVYRALTAFSHGQDFIFYKFVTMKSSCSVDSGEDIMFWLTDGLFLITEWWLVNKANKKLWQKKKENTTEQKRDNDLWQQLSCD